MEVLSFPLATSQSRTVSFILPTSDLPSGLNATECAPGHSPGTFSLLKMVFTFPLDTSHNRSDPLAEASNLPSGLNATDSTSCLCPKVAVSLPVATSQSRTLLSRPPEARSLPSGLNATENTQSVWPLSTAVSLPVVSSHTRTALSPPAEATSLPS